MKKIIFIFLIIMFYLLGGCNSPEKGDQGDTGNGVSSITLTKQDGLVDTYTIYFTDGTTTTFTVTNGKDGSQGIQGEPGKDGHTPVITIENGNWYIDGMNTGIKAEGVKGEKGDPGNGILSIELTSSEGLVDTYTIYYTDGTTTTFTVTNGKDSEEIENVEFSIIEKGSGYVIPYIKKGEDVSFGTFSTYTKYIVPKDVCVTIIMKTGGSYGFARTDKEGKVVESISNTDHNYYTFSGLNEITYLYVSDAKVASISHLYTGKENANYWTNKSIWWCGTSIPAGGYPLLVGKELGATIYQEAVGGSMIRANVSTGDYNGANISNITSSLSMTLEEANLFISNYNMIKNLDKNSSWEQELTASQKNRILSGTFETKLLPYLDGRKPMPDLFVIDHGHNDWKYKDINGNIDIELEPTIENIKKGLIAEDTYMTNNNYENLKKYFGDLSDIPADKLEQFVASVNRNCYKGAVNFIITLILKNNPRARIVFISNYEYENGYNKSYSNVINAQKSLAEDWCFPIFEIYKYLGYSDKIIPGSKEFMESLYPNYEFNEDVSVYEIYNVDKVHPSSDTTGYANEIYAGLISEFLKTIR